MNKDKEISCIRVYADDNQISSCKKRIESIEDSIRVVAGALNLAGNEVRLKILFLLKEEGELCPCDISDIITMTLPAVSQHLRKLKDGKLISAKKTGQTIFYSLTPEAEDMLKDHFNYLSKVTLYEKPETTSK